VLERVGKTVSGWFTSETFVKWLTVAVGWLANFIGATEDAESNATAWKNTLTFTAKILAVITAAMVTHVGWQQLVALWDKRNTEASMLYNIATKARAFTEGASIVVSQLYAATTMLLTGNVRGASQAIRVMTNVMKTTPWGFLISAVTALTVGYFAFKDSIDKTATAQDSFAKQQKKLADQLGKQTSRTKAHLLTLVNVINDTNVSLATRKKAYEGLIKIAPEFSGLIIKEGKEVTGLLAVYSNYVKALDQVARAKGLAKLNESNIENELAATQKLYNAETKLSNTRKEYNEFLKTDARQRSHARWADLKKEYEADKEAVKLARGKVNNAKKIVKETNDFKTSEVKAIEDRIKNGEKLLSVLEKQYGKETALHSSRGKKVTMQVQANKAALNAIIGSTAVPTDEPKSNYNIPAGDEKVKTKKGKEVKDLKNSLKLENQAKQNETLLKLSQQLEDDRINAMQDGYAKELLIENNRYQREIEDLDRQKVHADELLKMDKEVAKAKESKDNTKSAYLLEIKKGKLALHNNKLALIEEKGAMAILDKKKQAYETEKLLRETKYNEELAALGNNQIAKEALTKKHQEESLTADETFLKDSLEQLKTIVAQGDFNGIDLKLLTPEQIKEFEQLANEAGLKLSELIGKKQELSGGETKGNKNLGKMAALGLGTNTDIFGFSMENWAVFEDNIAKGTAGIYEMAVAVKALVNVWSKYDQFVSANENAQLDKFVKANDQKKVALKKRFDNGLITENDYNKKVKKLDDEVAEEKFQVELAQAKRKKAISITETIVNTAVSIMQGYAQLGPIGGTIAAVLLGTIGALQVSAIESQPLPTKGYEEGLYPEYVKRQQDGKVFKSKYGGKTKSGLVTDTSHFLVAENGPEMVIDNKAWKQMNPDVKDALIRDLRGIKGFEDGFYNNEFKRYEVPATSSTQSTTTPTATNNNSDQLIQSLMGVIAENTLVMKELRDNGVEGKFYKNDLKSAEILQDSIKDFNTLRNNAKK
jgi:tubulin-specific chaperone A